MANYSTLKADVARVIKTNGNNEITGKLMQDKLLSMIDSLGSGYQYAGLALPTTKPGSPDERVFYLATQTGTYTYFGGTVIGEEGFYIFINPAGSWQLVEVVRGLVDNDTLSAALSRKQNVLVSGTNIKTVNGISLLGSGDIKVSGGGGSMPDLNPDDLELSSDDKLQFADRPVYAADYHDRGVMILRPNIVDGKNVLTNAMINQENTIYIVRETFDINKGSIKLESGSGFRFEGGMIKNGTVLGTDSTIEAPPVKVFENISFSGSWKVPQVLPEWWGTQTMWLDPEKSALAVIDDSSLSDSSAAFNEALKFSGRTGGVVKASGCLYRCEDTIAIPKNCTLELDANTVLNFHMDGTGLLDGSKAIALYPNQYIPTASMAKAITLDGYNGHLIGHGWVIIKDCTYTIGIYVEGKYYSYSDMQFACRIDVRTVGGYKGKTAPDPDDQMGEGAPTTGSAGVNFYFDKTNNQEYQRTSSTAAWTKWKECQMAFNTSLRCEVSRSDSDYRLINTRFSLWDMFGYRGIEIIQANSSWYNQSVWDGTVSNKISNFVSVYGTNTSYHDMSRMAYQHGTERNKYGYFVYSESHGNSFGNVWDQVIVKGNPFMAWFTAASYNESVLWLNDSQVRNEGKNNAPTAMTQMQRVARQNFGLVNFLAMRKPARFFEGFTFKEVIERVATTYNTYSLTKSSVTATDVAAADMLKLIDTSPYTSVEIINSSNDKAGIMFRYSTYSGAYPTMEQVYDDTAFIRFVFDTGVLTTAEIKTILIEVMTQTQWGESTTAFTRLAQNRIYHTGVVPASKYSISTGGTTNANSLHSVAVPVVGSHKEDAPIVITIHTTSTAALSGSVKLVSVEHYTDSFVPSKYADPWTTKPTAPRAGAVYFNTTTGKPNWWNGTAWVDATGATV